MVLAQSGTTLSSVRSLWCTSHFFPPYPSFIKKKGRGSENQWETLSFLLYRFVCFIHFMHLPRDRNGLEAQIFLSPLILSPGSQILFSLGLKDLEDKRAIRVT